MTFQEFQKTRKKFKNTKELDRKFGIDLDLYPAQFRDNIFGYVYADANIEGYLMYDPKSKTHFLELEDEQLVSKNLKNLEKKLYDFLKGVYR